MTDRPVPADLINDVLWCRLDEVSLEHCRLLRREDGHLFEGHVLMIADAQPLEVHYTIDCALDWTTRAAAIEMLHGATTQSLHLRRDASGAWWRDGSRLPDFDGLRDVDLSITPSTNTLPIRRLELRIGETARTDAVWVRFPALSIERLPQQYTRTGERQYRYESSGGAFRADLEVDEHGMVTRYGTLWERAQA